MRISNLDTKELIGDLSQVVALLRKSSPGYTVVGAAITILEVVLGIGVLFAIKLLIDELSRIGVGVDGVRVGQEVFLLLGVVALGLLLTVALQSIGTFVRKAQGLHVGEFVDRMIHERAIEVDLSYYESPAYFDTLQRARQSGPQRPARVVSGLLQVAKSTAFLLGVLVMIGGIDWRILPFMLLAIGPVLGVRVRFTRKFFDWQRKRAQMERRASYLDWLVTSNHHAKELRLGGLGGYLRGLYGDVRSKINQQDLSIERQRTRSEFWAASVGAVVFAAATAFLVFEAAGGRQSIGDLVLFVLLFRRAENSGREFVSSASQLYDDRLYLRQIFDFLEVRPQLRAPAEPREVPDTSDSELRFEHVDFSYPEGKALALSGVNLELKPGKIVALVGENGSGKTSLVKIMTRLYDPSAGRVTFGGRDVRDFDPDEYRRLFSVVFQDFATYAETVRENIRFGDIRASFREGAIEHAGHLAKVDDFVHQLANGYETPLTRMFDGGQEISVGQWQRIALARAFYPRSRFVIMDEPTSALDARAEFELFDGFRERLEGRGALIISHRLSTVRRADYTYVLSDGRIVEQGTHEDLMKLVGLYASLFEKQALHYRN